MSRGAHARPPKPRRRLGKGVRTFVTVLGVLIGLAACAAIGWTVVMVTIRVGLLAGAGAIIGVAVVVALAWLTVSRRQARAAAVAR